MGKHVKPSKFEGQQIPKLAEAYLGAAHGFATSKKGASKAPTFAELVDMSFRATIVTPHEAEKDFHIDIERAKRGLSTGVGAQDRANFLSISAMRAYDIVNDLV